MMNSLCSICILESKKSPNIFSFHRAHKVANLYDGCRLIWKLTRVERFVCHGLSKSLYNTTAITHHTLCFWLYFFGLDCLNIVLVIFHHIKRLPSYWFDFWCWTNDNKWSCLTWHNTYNQKQQITIEKHSKTIVVLNGQPVSHGFPWHRLHLLESFCNGCVAFGVRAAVNASHSQFTFAPWSAELFCRARGHAGGLTSRQSDKGCFGLRLGRFDIPWFHDIPWLEDGVPVYHWHLLELRFAPWSEVAASEVPKQWMFHTCFTVWHGFDSVWLHPVIPLDGGMHTTT